MLVVLGLVEQRYQAVLEVLDDGATVTDVARRYGVARQTVHEWLRSRRRRRCPPTGRLRGPASLSREARDRGDLSVRRRISTKPA